MSAAKYEIPLGGKRARKGTGRARTNSLTIFLGPDHAKKLARIAEDEGITRTALIERWIDAHMPAPEQLDGSTTP